jgi:hypothetical protein
MNDKSVSLHPDKPTPIVLQISEGTNSVGIVRGIWAFAYVLLSAALFSE